MTQSKRAGLPLTTRDALNGVKSKYNVTFFFSDFVIIFFLLVKGEF